MPRRSTPKPPSTLWAVTVDGATWELDFLDIDGIEWRDAKAASLLSEREILIGVDNLDIEAIAVMLWIRRRRDEPDLAYEDLLGTLSLRKLGKNPPKTVAEEASTDPPV